MWRPSRTRTRDRDQRLTGMCCCADGRRHEHDWRSVGPAYGAGRSRRRCYGCGPLVLPDSDAVQCHPPDSRFPRRILQYGNTPAWGSHILSAQSIDSHIGPADLIPRPTPLPESGLAGWLDTFAFAFLDALPATVDREQVKAEVCRRLEVDMKHGEQWTTMYVRLRFKARKE